MCFSPPPPRRGGGETQGRPRGGGRAAARASWGVVPGVRSFYHWKGETQSSEEYLLIVKTSRDLFGALRAEMEKLHPYEVPELLALPVVAGAEDYLRWLQSNLRGAQE